MNLLDCGHYATEAIFCENMKELLAAHIAPQDDLQLLLSQVDLNPFVLPETMYVSG
jgi:putative NIF3 family GTP cyclohydrolase 1 type 2